MRGQTQVETTRGSLREWPICECHGGPSRAVSGQVGGEEADVGHSGFKRPKTVKVLSREMKLWPSEDRVRLQTERFENL